MLIDSIKSPADLKKLGREKLPQVASEIREGLFNRLTKKGGHFGPNFGIVEATVALHYVFDSPKEISGYTNPDESEHDFFNVGHTSTSVSLACGLAKARDLKGGKENIIAVIGDGSLSGGEALEGLDFAGEMATNFIIVVNDNDMSIAENHGGLYKNLRELRQSNGECPVNLFKAMGLDYIYVDKGNDVDALIDAFSKVKDINHPVVVHINTLKGCGYKPAEDNKEIWHWTNPFNRETGERATGNLTKRQNFCWKKWQKIKLFLLCVLPFLEILVLIRQTAKKQEFNLSIQESQKNMQLL